MPPCDFGDLALEAFNEPWNFAFFFCRYIKGVQCGGEMSADARPVFLVDAQALLNGVMVRPVYNKGPPDVAHRESTRSYFPGRHHLPPDDPKTVAVYRPQQREAKNVRNRQVFHIVSYPISYPHPP
jgi:hypothetical protein